MIEYRSTTDYYNEEKLMLELLSQYEEIFYSKESIVEGGKAFKNLTMSQHGRSLVSYIDQNISGIAVAPERYSHMIKTVTPALEFCVTFAHIDDTKIEVCVTKTDLKYIFTGRFSITRQGPKFKIIWLKQDCSITAIERVQKNKKKFSTEENNLMAKLFLERLLKNNQVVRFLILTEDIIFNSNILREDENLDSQSVSVKLLSQFGLNSLQKEAKLLQYLLELIRICTERPEIFLKLKPLIIIVILLNFQTITNHDENLSAIIYIHETTFADSPLKATNFMQMLTEFCYNTIVKFYEEASAIHPRFERKHKDDVILVGMTWVEYLLKNKKIDRRELESSIQILIKQSTPFNTTKLPEDEALNEDEGSNFLDPQSYLEAEFEKISNSGGLVIECRNKVFRSDSAKHIAKTDLRSQNSSLKRLVKIFESVQKIDTAVNIDSGVSQTSGNKDHLPIRLEKLISGAYSFKLRGGSGLKGRGLRGYIKANPKVGGGYILMAINVHEDS